MSLVRSSSPLFLPYRLFQVAEEVVRRESQIRPIDFLKIFNCLAIMVGVFAGRQLKDSECILTKAIQYDVYADYFKSFHDE